MTVANDIATGLQTALAVIPGFNAYEFIPESPLPPSIWVYPEDVDYRPTSDWVWVVQAVVAMNLDRAAQETLRALLDTSGASSVKAAVEADRTLGGSVDDVQVALAKGFQLFGLAGGLALGSTWTLNVVATG